ncbi:primosomal protein I [Desulfocucumis palustris]|uniref:Primosomal protein I n=1 Tax=Desulfocucumis palustris TaxID=1898651 RepID=A0A2L2XDI8_9FIRM|nr:hypothetical protein [Desulfocucumis palustris]GBF33783.1 primosomal protein I [Desulfocucumis palustris]
MAKDVLLKVLMDKPVSYHADFAKALGSVTAGLFLCQAIYWTGKGSDDDWFYKSRDDWKNELGMSRKEQETARKKLRDEGVLQEQKKGLPARLYYCISPKYQITLQGTPSHTVALGADVHGNITRLNNVLAEMPKKLEYCLEHLKTLRQQMETAKKEIDIPFEKEQELQSKSARLHELNILLNMDKAENEIMDDGPDENLDIPAKKAVGYER